MVIVDHGRLAVIERHRAGHHYFVLPGGGVEPGETLEAAAVREAHEELGVGVELLGPVGTVELTKDGTESRQHHFAATILSGTFGAGTGPEFAPDLDPAKGSYRATWLALEDAAAHTVHPRALITALHERGLADLLHDPLRVVELG